ncbi:hypothetical protein Btru_076392 [Bulinus truncatus]|nr:hypothetical protein Btru_076392 [Bulinus truncatus]
MPIPFAFHVVMSLHAFLGEGVDVVVMEVGIGGLNDSTNFIRHPVACAITSLGLDHTEKLGDTIESIAFQKSGIFKKQCPALTATQSDSAMQVLINRALERECPLYLVSPISKEIMEVYNFTLGIAGDKQRENAAIAVQLFHMWKNYRLNKCQVLDYPMNGVADIPRLLCQHLDEATIEGLSKCHWPGRAHVIGRPGVTYYLDGAHTKESMEVCASWFKEIADEERRKTKGKVVRVLLYYTGIQRNPEYLMYPLLHCGFDAAVFCPYVVSTVAAQCRLDLQQNKMHPDVQREIVERNKTIWEKLTCPGAGENNNVKEENFIKGSIEKEDPGRNDGTGSDSSDRNISSHNGIDRTMPIASIENNDSPDNSSFRNDISHRNDKYGKVGETVSTSQCVLQDGCTKNASYTLGNDLNCSLNSQCSLIFPSIIEALHWAGQGRDSAVQVLDPRSIPQQIPPTMKDAALVQILATGSLTIIGGILDVLSSFSGNMYSL